MTGQTTLRELLTQIKPTIACNTTASKSTKGKKWPELDKKIKRWDDFNIETLNKNYGNLLKKSLPNIAVLKPALKLGRSTLGLAPGRHLEHVHEDPRIPNAHPLTKVSHLIKLVGSPNRNLVVGLGTTSLKFQGEALSTAIDHRIASKHQNPVMQLAHACNLANARHGYIQTDNEVLACRFSCTVKVWEAEVMEIPMVLSGEGVMTTELAVWWLAMMAMPRSKDSVIGPKMESPRPDGSVSAGETVANNDHQANGAHPEVNPNPPSGANTRPAHNLDCIGGTYDANSEFASSMTFGDGFNWQQMEFDESQGYSFYDPHQTGYQE
ncbi:unnamed protein product [Clonostachys chloroleuca]|uniref:Uncharacterized protein n=1 Tax=Clonostachys chloroleuca TaxID=1926264 RepID=A0AA35LYY5_9HYPO|nr:unnamed protein product [Clonostachys chloroleuca]